MSASFCRNARQDCISGLTDIEAMGSMLAKNGPRQDWSRVVQVVPGFGSFKGGLMTKAVTIAAQDRIDLFEVTATEFFRSVLDMDYSECLVTDESRLSDFSSCGMPDELADSTSELEELYAAWRIWVMPVVNERYGLDELTPNILLVDLFQKIEQQRRAPGVQ